MTRKHYKLIAAALASTRPIRYTLDSVDIDGSQYRLLYQQWYIDVRELADVLASDNPNFDRVRFIKACGAREE